MAAAKARHPGRRGAEGEPDPGVATGCRGQCGEGPARAEWKPRPRARLVLGDEDRPPAALRLDRHLRGRALQTPQRIAARLRPSDPGHGADVVLPETVAEDGLSGIQVHPPAAQQRPHAGRSGHAQVAEPVLLLGVVGGQDLLRHFVDVGGGDAGDPYPGRADQRRVVGEPGEFPQAPVLEPGRADAVCPQQRGDRRTPLRQPAGVLSRGSRGVHVLQVDPVLDHVQHGGHILVNTGPQQFQDLRITAQLRDLVHDQPVDVRGYLGRPGNECVADLRGMLGGGRA